MFLLAFFLLSAFFIIFLLKVVSFLISESVVLNREELSSYECGFEHHNLSRVPFSLRYFLLTLVFLLFDLEVVLMLFVAYFSYSIYLYYSLLVLAFFLVILFVGLAYEWQDGSLD